MEVVRDFHDLSELCFQLFRDVLEFLLSMGHFHDTMSKTFVIYEIVTRPFHHGFRKSARSSIEIMVNLIISELAGATRSFSSIHMELVKIELSLEYLFGTETALSQIVRHHLS